MPNSRQLAWRDTQPAAPRTVELPALTDRSKFTKNTMSTKTGASRCTD
jgi:hypothetical protein